MDFFEIGNRKNVFVYSCWIILVREIKIGSIQSTVWNKEEKMSKRK